MNVAGGAQWHTFKESGKDPVLGPLALSGKEQAVQVHSAIKLLKAETRAKIRGASGEAEGEENDKERLFDENGYAIPRPKKAVEAPKRPILRPLVARTLTAPTNKAKPKGAREQKKERAKQKENSKKKGKKTK